MAFLIFFPFVLACAVSDLRTRRIPNVLILCGLIGAVLIRGLRICRLTSAADLPVLAADGCAGFLLPWLLFGPLAALKMIGGGDVKLLSVTGLWMGAGRCLRLMWYSLLIGAVWSAVLVIRRRNLLQRLYYLQRYVGQAVNTGKLPAYRGNAGGSEDTKDAAGSGGIPGAEDSSGEFCFAVPVLLSFLVVLTF